MKMKTFLAAAVLLSIASAGDAPAAKKERPPLTPAERCAKAILSAKERVLHREGVLLGRCVRAIAENAPTPKRRFRCSRMHRTGVGADRVERIARDRVLMHCGPQTMPAWLPPLCSGDGPELDRSLASPEDVAVCMVAGGRCLALTSVEQTVDAAVTRLSQQEPSVLDFELGGVANQTLRACLQPYMTTTTLPTASTTTTLDSEPTTTTLIEEPTTTTTMPAEPTTTTSMPSQPTTTLPSGTTTTTSTTVPEPEAPSIVITEIMSNPDAQSDSAGEYFEVLNTGTKAVDMQGWTVRDEGTNSFTIQDSVVITAGQYAIFARSQTAAGGSFAYVYGSAMTLANSADAIIIERDGGLVDAVAYDGAFPLAAGASMELSASATDIVQNDSAANWCAAQTEMADGDRGSPGAAGAACSALD